MEDEDTIDRIFILSVRDALNKNYGFSSAIHFEEDEDMYFTSSDNARRSTPTAYAAARGAYDEWMLRTPGDWDSTIIVNSFGEFYFMGDYPEDGSGVRPAMWITV